MIDAFLTAASLPSTPGAIGVLGGAVADDLARGAIAGAYIVGCAFLAGLAVFRMSALCASAFSMVLTAGALQLSRLGVLPEYSAGLEWVIKAIFVAALVLYASRAARSAAAAGWIGGALTILGLGVVGLALLNLWLGVDRSAVVHFGVAGTGVLGGAFVVMQAIRGSFGAQLMAPGLAMMGVAAFAPALLPGFTAELSAHGLFAFGVLATSLAALSIESPVRGQARAASTYGAGGVSAVDEAASPPVFRAPAPSAALSAGDNKLAQILDYSGVAVMDWRPGRTELSDRFLQLFSCNAGRRANPGDIRDCVCEAEQPVFEAAVFGEDGAAAPIDGSFDFVVRLRSGAFVRVRGARANDARGLLERLVMFAEPAEPAQPSLWTAAADAKADIDAAADTNAAGNSNKTAPTVDIARAIKDNALGAAFQPIVSLHDQSIRGYEALLRAVDDPKNGDATSIGDLSPEDLVAAAHAQDQRSALAILMMEACADFLGERIRRDGGASASTFAAFNMSYSQLRSDGFCDALRKAISSRHLPAKSLVIELTEADAVTDAAEAAKLFKSLRDAGAALAFDDFGAGFSSLGNLHKYDFDYLKIDKSFVGMLDQDGPAASKIVKALAGLGEELGMKVIAEGVENDAVAKAARDCGCHFGQGFAFGKAQLSGFGARRQAKTGASMDGDRAPDAPEAPKAS